MEFKNLEYFNPRACISSKMMRLNRITANIFRKHLSPFKVTDSQLSILFLLTKKDGLTQKQLSEIIFLEKSSLNRNLQRLFDRDYLSKNEFPIIKITLEGKRIVNQIIPEWEKAMHEIRLLIDQDGEDALNLLLSKLTKNKK